MRLGVRTCLQKFGDYFFIRKFPALRKLLFQDTTQYGEFLFLNSFFKGISSGFVVEVGANDGLFCSNSFPFIQRNWRALLTEPNPRLFKILQSRYATNPRVKVFPFACAAQKGHAQLFLGRDSESGYSTLCEEDSWWFAQTRSSESIQVPLIPLQDLLDQAGFPSNLDFLSVDTEGYDYHVFLGLDFKKHRPRLIMTEDEKPPHTYSVQKYTLLVNNGYSLIKKIRNNSIFALNDIYKLSKAF